MTTHTYMDDVSTDYAGSELEYERLGRQMVRELELFLRAELAHPREGRRISFRSTRRDGVMGWAAPVNPAKE
jgi:hypothetical protein